MSSSSPSPAQLAMYRLWAIWQIKNQHTATYFAAAICGLIAIFTVSHWTKILFNRYCSRPSFVRDATRSITRPMRRLNAAYSVLLDVRNMLALVYFGLMAALTFYDRPDRAGLTILGKRLGWMALLNLCLAIFLGLKNTPLSPLAGKSFDTLNSLHRCVGYTTILFMVVHVGTYLPGLQQHRALEEVMKEPAQIAGAVAGVAMVLIFVTAIGPVRRRQYEVFYVTHVVLVATILVAVGLHRPDLSRRTLIITIVAASLWFADKSLRMLRWIYFGYGNHCVLTPLANEATRVTMYRRMRAQPGSSAFLWIPSVRPFEKHPFTLVANEPAEFVIKAHDGFTRALYLTACKYPGVKFRAAVEGPYGHVPDVHGHDKVVLVAGGSGITFTINMALEWARRRRTPKDFSSMEFIWTVKHKSSLSWFNAELDELRSNSRVKVSLHVSSSGSGSSSETSSISQSEKVSSDSDSDRSSTVAKEPFPSLSTRNSESIPRPLYTGRPDPRIVVGDALAGMSPNKRVLVAVCGPRGLVDGMRRAVGEVRVWGAPGVEFHGEEFSF